MQDHYETLQVHPKADDEAIRAAYARLRERYDPARLEGAAEELQRLARDRRDEIERAFTVLNDPRLRTAYDAELAERAPAPEPIWAGDSAAADDDDLDYSPLPPARRQERPAGFNAQPTRRAARSRGRVTARAESQPTWLIPALIVAAATFGIVLVTLLSTVLSAPPPAATGGPQLLDPNAPAAPVATPSIEQIVNQFEGQIVAARQVANSVPENPNAWIELGNALYDSVIIVRERLGQGDQTIQNLYIERLPRWLEAAEAYRRASDLAPDSALARADLAASLCYYGQSINDPSYISEGVAEAEQALASDATEGRALLSAGVCYAFADPPRIAEALEQWQRLVVLPGAEPGLVFQARQLIQEYSR
jgi:curved DNA-binding protein CbpA